MKGMERMKTWISIISRKRARGETHAKNAKLAKKIKTREVIKSKL